MPKITSPMPVASLRGARNSSERPQGVKNGRSKIIAWSSTDDRRELRVSHN